METLTLNDGTVINGHILEGGEGSIFVYLDGMTILQGVTIFSDEENVSHIVANNHSVETVYDGYTEIKNASHEFGNCNLVMRRPTNA